ncbi:hypothetical protein LXL04_009384 [Taraxacum kok-saghyz]
MIADINSFVNRLRRDCKTGLLNRTNNVIFRNATNTLSHTLVNLLFVIGVLLSFDMIELQHKFWQPNVQQDSITAQFNYHSIQLQQNSITAHSIPQHYNQPNRPLAVVGGVHSSFDFKG